MKAKLRKVVFAYDFLISVIICFVVFVITPDHISLLFARDVYAVAISIFSIVFSVFFAAIAIMLSASDDEFAKYLIKQGDYDEIMWTYKFTLVSILASLVTAFVYYAVTSYRLGDIPDNLRHIETFSAVHFSFSLFFLSYGFFAAYNIAYDAIQYAKLRSHYLSLSKTDREKLNDKNVNDA